jgi:hypothetical protein
MNLANWKLVIDQIKANPSCWKQSSWHCGTSHCFGGWAQILSGKPADENTVRRDARVFLEISRTDADYYFSGDRIIEDFEWPLTDEAKDNDGYDRAGYNRDGYDRAGYDRAGYDRAGYDRAGYDCAGYDRAGYDCDGYDCDGYSRDGYDSDGLDANNKPKVST